MGNSLPGLFPGGIPYQNPGSFFREGFMLERVNINAVLNENINEKTNHDWLILIGMGIYFSSRKASLGLIVKGVIMILQKNQTKADVYLLLIYSHWSMT